MATVTTATCLVCGDAAPEGRAANPWAERHTRDTGHATSTVTRPVVGVTRREKP